MTRTHDFNSGATRCHKCGIEANVYAPNFDETCRGGRLHGVLHYGTQGITRNFSDETLRLFEAFVESAKKDLSVASGGHKLGPVLNRQIHIGGNGWTVEDEWFKPLDSVEIKRLS